jgi:outer membrane protein TolC
MDEKDSRSDFFPSFVFRSAYYPVKPGGADSDPLSYSLQWNSEAYNPVVAYFSLKAKQLVTQIATLFHHKAISEGLLRLAGGFLELDTVKRLAVPQKELVVLAQKNLAYLQEQLKLGEKTPLEVQIASQELEVAQAEKERLDAEQIRLQDTLRAFIGVKPEQDFTFNLHQVPEQILGSFDANTADWGQTKANSLEIKTKSLLRDLQGWNITLAKMKLLPSFFLGVQTPDPLNTSHVRGLYFSMGLTWTIPVLGGDKRFREVFRQKTVLDQATADLDVSGMEQKDRWQSRKDKLRQAAVALKTVQSQEELARLKERQSDILYQAGGEAYSILIEARRKYLNAQMKTIMKLLEYNQAKVQIRHLSGDLLYRYVDERI